MPLSPTRSLVLLIPCLLALPAQAHAEGPALVKQTHVYKTVGDVKIQADVHKPDDARVRPVVVWIHGGALIMGSRTSVPRNLLELCQTEGYALVSLDYRLAPEVKLPAIAEDVEDAFRWLREQGPKLGLDPDRLVIAGGSAGGYLTLLAGSRLKPAPRALVAYWGYGDVDGEWYTKPSEHYRKQALVEKDEAYKGVGGQVLTGSEGGDAGKGRSRFYLYLRQNGLWTKEVTSFDPAKEPRKLDTYCPVRNVTAAYPPTMLVHGTEDTDVPYDLSAAMAKELARQKVAHELVTVKGAGHGLAGGDKQLVAEAHEKALAFIREHLKGRKQGQAEPIRGIELVVVCKGRDGGTTWFHPRACMVPGDKGSVAVMTLQSISGSDVFGPVHWSESADLGKTWSEPKPISGLGRRPPADGLEEGVCDVVPEYHAATKSVLAIGHNVFYKAGKLAQPQPPRHPVYVVRGPDGQWSLPRTLEWDDPRATLIYTCGCSQRVTQANGDLLISLSFGSKERTDRSVCTVLCSFDGKTLTVKKAGNELRKPVGRGLLEPSLAVLDGRYYMTIRAEDGHGYVTTSKDGLTWAEPTAWQWDDGTALAMSTTQQRWLVHSDALYLVYTRKAEENVNVMRWRAPLYLAKVDRETLRLVRATERVAVPLVGDGVKDAKHVAHLGNFHTTAASADESWVTVGEVLPADGYRGDLLLARIRWERPNGLARP